MSAEGTTDAAARAAEPPSATDPGVGGETTPPIVAIPAGDSVGKSPDAEGSAPIETLSAPRPPAGSGSRTDP